MTRQTITAVIPAKNEEKNIGRCLKSVDWCDRVIVLWMGTDKTGEIAKKMGAEVVEMGKSNRDDFVTVQKNINWAIKNCRTDWILRIDADEEVEPDLKKEILTILKSPKKTAAIVAYGIPRKQYFWGGFLKGGDWAYDRLVRLFRPQYAIYNFSTHVHEQLVVDGEVDYLKNHLKHYSHPTLKDAIRKFDIYTSIQIEDLNESLWLAFLKMIFVPPYVFGRWMIWHHGYRDGIRGLVAGALRAWYDFILYKKYLQKRYQQGLTLKRTDLS